MENEFEIQRSLGRIEGGQAEIKTEIRLLRDDHAGLRAEFNKLEAGRLTKLESAFAISQAEAHTKARNTALIYSSIVGAIGSILVAIILHLLKV